MSDSLDFLRADAAHAPLLEAVEQWRAWDTNAATLQQLADALAVKNVAELSARLLHRIQFGTAGLRGAMRYGFDSMNELTVLQATQGLCRYVQSKFTAEECATRGVVIGCDARHNSAAFTKITAATFLSQGVKVNLFTEVVPTPFVSFGTTHCNALAGVMVTASHNPKQDNGYKVYWENGAQIIPPHDKGIADLIAANLVPWGVPLDTSKAVDITEAVATAYYATSVAKTHWNTAAQNAACPSIVFTPMHGVGQKWVERVFAAYGLPPAVSVPLQQKPDPDFPTVPFPNPEEGKGALALAMAAAAVSGSRIIIANDPDSDRLAAAEFVDDQWKIFTGNEIGALLAHWTWVNHKKSTASLDAASPSFFAPADCIMLNSTVSSKLLSSMAKKEGFLYEETLTGFKWLGNEAEKARKNGKKVLFAFEEAIGFMVSDVCLDKDGVRAAAVFAEMVSAIPSSSPSLYLTEIYNKYGHYRTQNKYFFCYDPATLAKIFKKMRDNYPTSIGPYKVQNVRDLTVGYDSSTADHKPLLPTSASTEMITFSFENGAVCTLRGSGTEPKLKYYAELFGPDPEAVVATLADMVKHIIATCLEPEANGLKPPTD